MFGSEPSANVNQFLWWDHFITIFLTLSVSQVQPWRIVESGCWWLKILIFSGQISFEVYKEWDFFFQLLGIVFEEVLVVDIFPVYFLDIVEFFFVQGQDLSAIVEEDSVGIVVEDVSDSILWAVVYPLLYRCVFWLLFSWFCLCEVPQLVVLGNVLCASEHIVLHSSQNVVAVFWWFCRRVV